MEPQGGVNSVRPLLAHPSALGAGVLERALHEANGRGTRARARKGDGWPLAAGAGAHSARLRNFGGQDRLASCGEARHLFGVSCLPATCLAPCRRVFARVASMTRGRWRPVGVAMPVCSGEGGDGNLVAADPPAVVASSLPLPTALSSEVACRILGRFVCRSDISLIARFLRYLGPPLPGESSCAAQVRGGGASRRLASHIRARASTVDSYWQMIYLQSPGTSRNVAHHTPGKATCG